MSFFNLPIIGDEQADQILAFAKKHPIKAKFILAGVVLTSLALSVRMIKLDSDAGNYAVNELRQNGVVLETDDDFISHQEEINELREQYMNKQPIFGF